MPYPITRRHLFGGVAGLAAGLALPQAVRAGAAAVTLTAGRRVLEVNGRAATVFGLTQPDGTSGLFTEMGRPFQVVLDNDTGTDTLVHWHGLAPPWRQDGVPDVSAPAIPHGGSASYDFPLTGPGTFWMHSHQGLQEQSLLSAPLIVRDPAAAGADRQEVVLMLHDFSFQPPQAIYAGLRGMPGSGSGMAMPGMEHAQVGSAGMAMDLNDVAYDAFLANDRTLDDPQVVRVEQDGRVLLRVINAAASSNFHVDLGPVSAWLVAVDGQAVHPVAGSNFPLAIAQRIDLEFSIPPGQSSVPVFATLEGERTRTGIVLATVGATVARLPALARAATAPLTLDAELALRAARPLVARKADRVHAIDLTGSMQGYAWGLNGIPYVQAKPLMVAKGERVELVMANRTSMSHPMHLHGHAFQVMAIDGRAFAGAVRDTVLVPPMKSVTVAFDADNPGHWAFHCHNLYHMEAGMMTTVAYEGV